MREEHWISRFSKRLAARSAWAWRITVAAAFSVFICSSSYTVGQSPSESIGWRDADGAGCSFASYEEFEQFLVTARVVELKTIGATTGTPFRMTLTDGKTTLHAIFRHVDILKRRFRTADRLEVDFRDSALFECAAYRLSRLLEIGHIPPTVRRDFTSADFLHPQDLGRLPHREGSIQAWVEDAFTEKTRRRGGPPAPQSLRWLRQIQLMWLFDQLIDNSDRNQGNMLIDSDWTLWFIDATRSFRTHHKMQRPERVNFCDRRVWARLKSIPDETLETEMAPFLQGAEIRALLARRLELVAHFERLIRKRGEDAVLF